MSEPIFGFSDGDTGIFSTTDDKIEINTSASSSGSIGSQCWNCGLTSCSCYTRPTGFCLHCGQKPCACHSTINNTSGITFPCGSCGTNPCACWSFKLGTSSSTFSVTNDNKYSIFELPIPDVLPNKVYVSGRLLTVGILGSDVQAAYNGKDKLVFAPGEIAFRYNEKLTVSLEYGEWLYHYNILFDDHGSIAYEEDSNILKVKLLSKVAQK